MSEPVEREAVGVKRMSPVRVAVQVLGFAASLGLLAWCVRIALKDENRDALDRVLHGDPWLIAGMLGLCVLSLVANGSLFVVMIAPVRRVHWLSCCATNALATFLNNFPFKLSLASRFLIHKRRDGLPLLMIAAWIGATAAVILAVLGATLVATMWRGGVDALWWVSSVGAAVVGFAVIVGCARVFAGEAGKERLARLVGVTRIGVLERVVRGAWFAKMHTGLDMLASPRAVGSGMLLRVIDTAFIAGRFAVAAELAGVEASMGSVVLAATLYFFIGAVTPSGALGARDGGTFGAMKFLPAAGAIGSEFAVVILTVTASEFVVNLCTATASALYLRFSKARPATVVAGAGGEVHAR